MKKASLAIIVGFFLTICIFFIWKYQRESAQYAFVKRTLTDDALSFFREDIKELGRKQVMLQQAEIDSQLLALAKNDAELRSKIESIPFWLSFRQWGVIGSLSVFLSGLFVFSVGFSIAYTRRNSLVKLMFGTVEIMLPYRQVNSEHGVLKVFHAVLTALSQGTLDKEEILQIVHDLRHTGLRPMMLDITPGQEESKALPAAQSISFHDAKDQFRPDEILTGYHDGHPIYFPIKGFVSAAAGGESGSGKTSKLRFLIGQLICSGANVSILDAHDGMEESLVTSLGSLARFPNVTIYHSYEARDAIESMTNEIQHIFDAKITQNPPRVYILDELRPIVQNFPETEHLMDLIANQGRKFQVYGIFASQTWEARMFKDAGSASRDACVLKIAARMPKEQARILFKKGDAAKAVSRLTMPEMYIDSVRFSGVVNVPFASTADMELLALEYFDKRQHQIAVNHDVSGIVSDPVLDSVPKSEIQKETQAQDIDGQGETWLAAYMQTHGFDEQKIADRLCVSLSLVKKILRGERALTAENKSILEAFQHPSNIVPFPGGKAS